MIDPKTLEILATYNMPNAPDPPGTKAYQNFAGGGYFFLDKHDRIWSATKTSHVFVLQVVGRRHAGHAAARLRPDRRARPDERITSALPDFRGRIWFVSKKSGKVGILYPRSKRIRYIRLGEEIENSFTVDRRGVYIVSTSGCTASGRAAAGRPRVQWKAKYRELRASSSPARPTPAPEPRRRS